MKTTLFESKDDVGVSRSQDLFINGFGPATDSASLAFMQVVWAGHRLNSRLAVKIRKAWGSKNEK